MTVSLTATGTIRCGLDPRFDVDAEPDQVLDHLNVPCPCSRCCCERAAAELRSREEQRSGGGDERAHKRQHKVSSRVCSRSSRCRRRSSSKPQPAHWDSLCRNYVLTNGNGPN